MPGFSLLSLSPKLILLCLLCDHAGGLYKYFSFAKWHDIKPYQLQGLVRYCRKKGFLFPPLFQCSLLVTFLQHTTLSSILLLQSRVSLLLVFWKSSFLQHATHAQHYFSSAGSCTAELGGCSRSWFLQHGVTFRTRGQQLSPLPPSVLQDGVLLVRYLPLNDPCQHLK